MTSLKDVLSESTIEELRQAIEANQFPGVSFEHAMKFLLSDGIVPASGLPVDSFLRLEDWARARLPR